MKVDESLGYTFEQDPVQRPCLIWTYGQKGTEWDYGHTDSPSPREWESIKIRAEAAEKILRNGGLQHYIRAFVKKADGTMMMQGSPHQPIAALATTLPQLRDGDVTVELERALGPAPAGKAYVIDWDGKQIIVDHEAPQPPGVDHETPQPPKARTVPVKVNPAKFQTSPQ